MKIVSPSVEAYDFIPSHTRSQVGGYPGGRLWTRNRSGCLNCRMGKFADSRWVLRMAWGYHVELSEQAIKAFYARWLWTHNASLRSSGSPWTLYNRGNSKCWCFKEPLGWDRLIFISSQPITIKAVHDFVHALDWTDSLWQTQQGLGRLGGFSTTCSPTNNQSITKLVSWHLFGRIGNWHMAGSKSFSQIKRNMGKGERRAHTFLQWHTLDLGPLAQTGKQVLRLVAKDCAPLLTDPCFLDSRNVSEALTSFPNRLQQHTKSIPLSFRKSLAAVHHWTFSQIGGANSLLDWRLLNYIHIQGYGSLMALTLLV